MKTLALTVFAAALWLLSGAVPVHGAETKTETAASCAPLVRFFGETVCETDFMPDTDEAFAGGDMAEEQRQQLKEQIAQRNRNRMQALLWQKALERRFGAAAVTPREEDIAAFRQAMVDSMETSYQADKKTIAYLKDVLAAQSFDEEKQTRLRAILAAAETGVRFYEERKKQMDSLPPEYAFIAEAAETEIARGMLARWQADKILFEAYNGRLAMGPSGPEPVDAYAAFLRYIAEEAQMEIVDKTYDGVFDDIKLYAAADHTFLTEEDDIYRHYFTDPLWQLKLANSASRLDDLKEWVETRPRK